MWHRRTFGADLGQQQMKLQHELLAGNGLFAGGDQQVEQYPRSSDGDKYSDPAASAWDRKTKLH